MFGLELRACLFGLGGGAATVLYLFLVLRVIAATKGIWRNVLRLLWPVLWAWPLLLVWVVVAPRVAPPAVGTGFMLLWALPIAGFLVGVLVYQRAHPDAFGPDPPKRRR